MCIFHVTIFSFCLSIYVLQWEVKFHYIQNIRNIRKYFNFKFSRHRTEKKNFLNWNTTWISSIQFVFNYAILIIISFRLTAKVRFRKYIFNKYVDNISTPLHLPLPPVKKAVNTSVLISRWGTKHNSCQIFNVLWDRIYHQNVFSTYFSLGLNIYKMKLSHMYFWTTRIRHWKLNENHFYSALFVLRSHQLYDCDVEILSKILVMSLLIISVLFGTNVLRLILSHVVIDG